ncbi:MAG: glycosyltransferase family 4 protein [Bryobacteraceae bacterium]
MSIKIGIDAHGVGGNSLGCGNETYFGNLIKSLLDLDPQNEYHIFTNRPEHLAESIGTKPNAKLVSLIPHSQWLQRPISVPLYAKKHKLDILHFPFVRPPFTRARCVITVHDVCFETYPEYFRTLEHLRMRTLIPRSCRRADCIFTVSEAARQEIHGLYGIDLAKIVVTPNAADHIQPSSRASSTVRVLGVPTPYILYAGVLQPRKNLVRLVQAFDQLKSNTSLPHKLVLCGKWGWGNEDLKRCLTKSPNRENIHLTGYLPSEQFHTLMAGASLFVFPSLFEGFGIPPMEAQGCKVPVVVSETSCFPEIYGDSVLYCDPFDSRSIARAIERAPHADALRSILIERGNRNWRRYSWSKTAGIALRQYVSLHNDGVPVSQVNVRATAVKGA